MTRGKESTGNVVFSASVGRLPFASFQQKFELRIPKIENSFKAGQVFQASPQLKVQFPVRNLRGTCNLESC